MQLLEIILYNTRGDRRTVSFRPGALNVVTGDSATGKSALLAIFEYCLGRDTVVLPFGPITNAVSWYAALFQLENCRAFAARPAPGPRGKATKQAMLRLSHNQEPLEYHELRAELDTRSLREQLGRRIGISETIHRGARGSTEPDIGHAALLCLQGQTEIANKDLLFHRQSERGIATALRATLPYFLGAVPPAQARKDAQLTAARHEAGAARERYLSAREAQEATSEALVPLWEKALELGMVPPREPDDSAAAIEALQRAITEDHDPELTDVQTERQAVDLRRRCVQLRDQLRALTADRRILLDHIDAAADYAQALEIPTDRLASLNLLGLTEEQQQSPEAEWEASICVLCGSHLPHADPTAAALSRSLGDLTRQLATVTAVPVAGRRALERLDAQAAGVRSELLAAEGALEALMADQGMTEHLSHQRRVDFLRGRIHGVLSTLPATSPEVTARLGELRASADAEVEARAADLAPRAQHREFSDRLVAIDRDITTWAQDLGLEPSHGRATLDRRSLTINFRTPQGRYTLAQIGSGQNWVGYHVLAHLALHRYFVRHNRPVPRILMLDQPTQVWSPGGEGSPDQADQEATRRLFELIDSVVKELAPDFQVIIVDHANLPHRWFQDAVVENWHGLDKLVPNEWL